MIDEEKQARNRRFLAEHPEAISIFLAVMVVPVLMIEGRRLWGTVGMVGLGVLGSIGSVLGGFGISLEYRTSSQHRSRAARWTYAGGLVSLAALFLVLRFL